MSVELWEFTEFKERPLPPGTVILIPGPPPRPFGIVDTAYEMGRSLREDRIIGAVLLGIVLVVWAGLMTAWISS